MTRTEEDGADRRGPPLASTLAGWDIVMVELASDFGEGGSVCALVADLADDLGPKRRPAARR